MDNGDLSQLLKDLKKQVQLLEERCVRAEARIAELNNLCSQQQMRIGELGNANQELTQRFQNLQASSASGRTAEETEALRERYLALIREIDDCIAKLNGHRS